MGCHIFFNPPGEQEILLFSWLITPPGDQETNVYSVQLGQELTFMPNLRLKIDSTLKGGEGVFDLPLPHKIVGLGKASKKKTKFYDIESKGR